MKISYYHSITSPDIIFTISEARWTLVEFYHSMTMNLNLTTVKLVSYYGRGLTSCSVVNTLL